MAKHGLFAVVAATVLCTGVMAATMASSLSPEARWNDLSVSFRKYHSDHTNIFFHLITTPLGVLSVFSLFNKATNTTIFTVCDTLLAQVYHTKGPPPTAHHHHLTSPTSHHPTPTSRCMLLDLLAF